MRAVLLTFGILLVLALSALFAVPMLVDWGAYRGTFESELTRILGREVRVGEKVSLRLLPSPYLEFENVRIADSTGRFDTPLLRMQGFTLWLAISPLLQGSLEAREVVLRKPIVRLAVDEAGEGNWRGLGGGGASLPFVPATVSLGSVSIEDGELQLATPGREAVLDLTRITGELAAPSLSGPYRFKGRFGPEEARRGLRFSTGVSDGKAEGIRIKSVVELPATGGVHTFDGTLLGIDGRPRLQGTLESRLTVGATGISADGTPAAAIPVELKARIDADVERLRLTDATLTLVGEGRPQQITAEATADWSETLNLEARLAAGWLDLDAIARRAPAEGPWQVLQRLLGEAGGALPAGVTTHLQFDLAQATLAGEQIAALRADITHLDGAYAIASASAELPHGARISFGGRLAAAGGDLSFSGPAVVRGRDLGGVLRWALPAAATFTEGMGNSRFLVQADWTLAPAEVRADNARAEIAGTIVTGHVASGGTELDIGIDSDRLDLRELVVGPISLAGLRGLLAGSRSEPAGATAADSTPAGLPPLPTALWTRPVKAQIRLGHLLLPDDSLRDLALTLEQRDGKLAVRSLGFSSDSGLAVTASGDLGGSGRPGGELRFVLEAGSAASLEFLSRLASLPPAWSLDPERAGRLVPMRLAGRIDLGRSRPETLEIDADGVADTSRLIVETRFEGRLETLEAARLDLGVSLTNADGARLVGLIAGRDPGPGAATAPPAPAVGSAPTADPAAAAGSLTLRASGIVGEGLESLIALDSGPLSGSFEGRITPARDGVGLDGLLSTRDTEAARLLGLAGLGRLAPGPGVPMALAANLTRVGPVLKLTDLRLEVGEHQAAGDIAVDGAAAKPHITASLDADYAWLPALLAPIVGPLSPVSEASALLEGRPIAWTDAPFDLAPLEACSGEITLSVDRLELRDGLGLGDAQAIVTLGEGRLGLTRLEGSAAGGRLVASGTLAREPGGASLAAEIEIADADLTELVRPSRGAPRAEAQASLRLKAQGRGLSPRSLMAMMAGTGEIRLTPGRLRNLSPLTVNSAALALLASPLKITPDRIAAEIVAARPGGEFAMPPATLGLGIADGAIKSEGLTLSAEAADLAVSGSLDLQSLEVDGRWTLTPKSAKSSIAALPPVTLSYKGPIEAIVGTPPSLEAGALERELTARRILGGEMAVEGLWPPAAPAEPDVIEEEPPEPNAGTGDGDSSAATPAAAGDTAEATSAGPKPSVKPKRRKARRLATKAPTRKDTWFRIER